MNRGSFVRTDLALVVLFLVSVSVYALFFATLSELRGSRMLVGLATGSLIGLVACDARIQITRRAVTLLLAFFAVASLGLMIPVSTYTSINWFILALGKLALSAIIVFSVYALSAGGTSAGIAAVAFRRGCYSLCLLISIFVVSQNLDPMPEFLASFRFPSSAWNKKFHGFWLLFLMWGTLSLYPRVDRSNARAVFVLFVFVLAATFVNYSESARLALLLSLLIYAAMHYRERRVSKLIEYSTYLYIVSFPLLWTFTPLRDLFMEYDEPRFRVYEAGVDLISSSFWMGHGFGSCLKMPVMLAEDAPRGAALIAFPGGHPHSIVLLAWIEMGIFGAAVLLAAIHAMIRTLTSRARTSSAPARWALFVSGLTIFSFSFANWQADFVLSFTLFLSMFVLGIARSGRATEHESGMSYPPG